MNQPHLDDEQLSADLDGLALDERDQFHLEACADCAGRRQALATASEAVAAPVAPLDAAVLDGLVAKATAQVAPGAEGGPEVVTSLDARRRIRPRPAAPPRAWLTGVAAALVVLAGLAALVQTNSRGDDNTAAFSGTEDMAVPGPLAEAGAGADRSSSSAAAMADPAVVAGDIGDQEDPALLVVALSGSVRSERVAAASPVQDDAAPTAQPSTAGEAAPQPGVPAASPREAQQAAPAAGQDRALCVRAAREIGAGRLGGHRSTSTLRWKGRPAEVLVFELTEPAAGVSLQALVLSRPGCDLLADPRF